ncbi:MAG: hypothetical protein DHS20C16_07160 [Phycisphaerae bacterium]|nr:MAG: hypothetical protein DHS20C16_07160 [Phycisphaerae bacterium]
MNRGLHNVSPAEAECILLRLLGENCTQFTIDGLRATDKRSFIESVKSVIPMDPPLAGNNHWDAFSDSLFGGVSELATKQVVIVWRNSNTMAQQSSEDYAIALECLDQLCNDVGDPKISCEPAKDVFVLLA